MRINKLFAFLALMFLFSHAAMAAPNYALSVHAEPVGTEVIYHYTLSHSGPEKILTLRIGVEPSNYECRTPPIGQVQMCGGNYYGTLEVMPSGTTWAPNAHFSNLRETAVLSATATTQPVEWEADAFLLRALGGSSNEGPGFVRWTSPFRPALIQVPKFKPAPIYKFSVRVPAGPTGACKPCPPGQVCPAQCVRTNPYVDGLFAVEYMLGLRRGTVHAEIKGLLVPPSITVPATANSTYTVSWESSGPDTAFYQLEAAPNLNWHGKTVYPPQTGLSQTIPISSGGAFTGSLFYRVRACTTTTVCSDYRTDTIGVMIGTPTLPAIPPYISVPPGGLRTGYKIGWGESLGNFAVIPGISPPTHYELQESKTPGFNPCQPCPPGRFCTQQCVSNTTSIYTGPNLIFDVGPKAAGTYYYRVLACNRVGCSDGRVGSRSVTIQ